MLLNELEPGALFRLTPASIALEAAARRGDKNMVPGTEPYLLLMPNLAGNPAQIAPAKEMDATRFYPRCVDYEVEVLGYPGLGSQLPSRTQFMTSCDPEVFLEDEKGNILPGFAVMPPKKKPIRVSGRHGGVFHEDGFQAEFSPEPRHCHEQVVTCIQGTIHRMLAHVNGVSEATYREYGHWEGGTDVSKGPIKISNKSFVELTPELLAMGTDAQVALGCESSENVWGHSWFTHDKPRAFPYRMAGGHIHLGTKATAKWLHARAERIIKAMDVFCGVPSVALLDGLEDPRRRQFYGRAGEYRLQPHGLEYRTLSNAWLQHQSLTHLTFNLARAAFRIGMMDWEKFFPYDPAMIRHIINDHDVPAAQQFIADNAKVLIWALDADAGYGWGAKGLTTLHNGAKKVFGKKLGIHKTWVDPKFAPNDPRFQTFVANANIKSWPGYTPPVPVNVRVPRPTLDSLLAEQANIPFELDEVLAVGTTVRRRA